MLPVEIGPHLVGPGNPCFIIAEAGVNHNGDMQLARQLIEQAVQCGADAIKFQSFITEALITPRTPKANYQIEATGSADSQYAMLKALELSAQQQAKLQAYCQEIGITYLCTPYDEQSVDWLADMGVAAFKIASTDANNSPFLRYIAKKKRPILLSTGMATLAEIEAANSAILQADPAAQIINLHCTSEYPTPLQEVNLRAIMTLQQAFQKPTGFSDHTVGIDVSTWAAAMGACVIEKHFTLSRNMVGPDHRASIEPQELSALVTAIRALETAQGDGVKRPMPSEYGNKSVMRKSLVARRQIPAGAVITPEDLTCKRPGTGLSPSWFDTVVGQSAITDILIDDMIHLSSIAWDKTAPLESVQAPEIC